MYNSSFNSCYDDNVVSRLYSTDQGGVGIAKKDQGLFFLETARSSGLTRYVIRGTTIYGSTSPKYGLTQLHNLRLDE